MNNFTDTMQDVPGVDSAINPGGDETAPALYDGSPWPAPLKPAAFHGLAGEIVRRIEPHTESDSAALLAQFLLAFGNTAGRAAHWLAEDTPHFTNEFAVIVGQSSVARKGTSLDRILALFAGADLYWSKNLVSSGLVSGEGVVHAIRDAKRNEQGEIEDEGARDKRLFVTESEFASVLSVFARKENTLFAIPRNAWDSKTLRTLAKNVGEVASEPHVTLAAHITFDELKSKLAKEDLSSGVANRFLWICARRSKLLPHGGTLRAADRQDLTAQLSARLTLAKTRGLVGFTAGGGGFMGFHLRRLESGTPRHAWQRHQPRPGSCPAGRADIRVARWHGRGGHAALASRTCALAIQPCVGGVHLWRVKRAGAGHSRAVAVAISRRA